MNTKIRFLFFSLIMGFFLILGKAFYIQIINRDALINYAESQFLRSKKIYPQRGMIFDRNGSPLAINVRNFNLALIPKSNKEILSILKKIHKIIPQISVLETYKKLKDRDKFSWITRDISISDEQYQQIKKIKKLIIEESFGRIYPNHELMAQLIGFVGVDNNGLAGIEYQFNESLKGDPTVIRYFKDAKGRPIKFQSFAQQKNKENDLHLSLDKTIQVVLEESLKESVDFFKADSAGAGLMDASTGEILAVANYPTFDPNHYSKYSIKDRKLSFFSDPFEPGSTMKTFTVLSGFENKIINEESNYYCEKGSFKVQNHFITEADSNKKHEWLSVTDIIKYSSNIGVTKIAFDIGEKKLLNTFSKFTFGQKTGIEYPGESRGIFPTLENLSQLQLSNISFGHAIATTGIQMLSAYATILNNGNYIQPTILKVTNKEKLKQKRIISEELALKAQDMLYKAVEDGTGSNAKINHFKIGGKTSTAQRVDENGGYKGYISGFAGMTLNTNKKLVAYAYVNNPKENGYYGNLTGAPIVSKIFKFVLYKDKDSQNFNLNANNNEFVDAIHIKKSSLSKKNMVPDLIGKDRISVQKISNKINIKVNIIGNGIVYKQVPDSTESLTDVNEITVYLKVPKNEY